MILWLLQLTLTQNRSQSVRCATASSGSLLLQQRPRRCRILFIAINNSRTSFASTPSHCNTQYGQLRLAISTLHNTPNPQTRWRDADAEVVERCCCRQSTIFSSSFRPAQRSRYGCSNSWASVLREPLESVILSPCSICAHTDHVRRVSMSS